jgi:hypothetical protein
MSQSKAPGTKSAYEAALERLEKQGIKRPEDSSLTDEDRRQIADLRNRAEAKLAEVEILYRDRTSKGGDFSKRQEDEEHYQRERRRIEDERDRRIETIRRGKS